MVPLHHTVRAGFLISLVLLLPAVSLTARSELPRVGVFPTVNSTGAEQYDAVGRVIYDTTVLTLRLIGAYELVELSPAERLPSEAELLEIATEQSLANIVIAEIRLDLGELALEMAVFDTLAERITLSQREDPPGLLAVFEATDILVAELVEEFSGVPVGFASLVLRSDGEPGSYRLYLDGEPIGDNVGRVERVLMGERRVEIRQQRMMGEYTVHTESLLLAADEQRDIVFSIPYLTDQERLVLESFERQIQAEIERPQNEHRIEELFGSAASSLAEIEYSPGLVAERERLEELRALWQQDIEAWRLLLRPRWIFPLSVGYGFPLSESLDQYFPEPGPVSVVGASRRFGQTLYLGVDVFVTTRVPLPVPLPSIGLQPAGSQITYRISGFYLPFELASEVVPLILTAGVIYRRIGVHLYFARQSQNGDLIMGPLVGVRF